MLSLKKYSASCQSEWDRFVESSKNFHFMFYRSYMDYHSDRFIDYSLMFYDEKNCLIALFPANLKNDILHSHQGLTFGGFIYDKHMRASVMLEIVRELIDYCKANTITEILYKKIPYIYHSNPADEDMYALFRMDAKLYRRDISSAIDLNNRLSYSKGRKYNLSVAKKNNLFVIESEDYGSFWEILIQMLQVQHEAMPTHTIDEIKLLHARFPKNIRLFLVYGIEEKPLAGALAYSTNLVAHMQYLVNTTEGRRVGALDFVIDYLICDVYKDKQYFDFGISNENNGQFLNEGLIEQKEGFGARAICHDFYSIRINE